jgi:hypothetical protein
MGSGGLLQDRKHQAQDGRDCLFRGWAVGSVEPLFDGTVDGPADCGSDHRWGWQPGLICWLGGHFRGHSSFEDVTNCVGDGRIDEGLEGALTVRRGRVAMGLGEVVAGGEDDCTGGGRAGAVELDVAVVEEFVEIACDGGFEEGVLVGVVVVEGGSIDGGGFGDVLDGDIVEALCLHEGSEGLLQELAGAPDPWIAYFTV